VGFRSDNRMVADPPALRIDPDQLEARRRTSGLSRSVARASRKGRASAGAPTNAVPGYANYMLWVRSRIVPGVW